jgi:folate-dependent phosphoribosylglycinamide formyltransferase PurN
MKVAVVSNGNVFSMHMLRPVFDDPSVEVTAVGLVRVPAGSGGSAARLVRLARKTGVRYTTFKALSLLVPAVAARTAGAPATLEQLAGRRGVAVQAFSSANSQPAIAFLRRGEPDVLISVSCPERLGDEALAAPSIAAINIHWGLLPKDAGIAPYFWVLRDGELAAGLTVHIMAPEVDTGPVLRAREIPVESSDSVLSLQLRLARAGADELAAAVRALPGSLKTATDQVGEGSYHTWPSPADVRALRLRGRALWRRRDLKELRRFATGG